MLSTTFETFSSILALLVGLPTIVLCVLTVIASNQKITPLNSAFYRLFVIAGVNDMVVFLLNMFSARLPATGHFNNFYWSIREGWIPTITLFLFYHAAYAQLYGCLILALNRLSAVIAPVKYTTFWGKMSIPTAAVMFGLPFLFDYHILIEGAAFEDFSDPDQTTTFFFNRLGPNRTNKVSRGVSVTWNIFVVCILTLLINSTALLILFRRRKEVFSRSVQVEVRLYITTTVIFFLQMLSTIQQMLLVYATNPVLLNFLVSLNPPLCDVNSLAPLWLIFFASKTLRRQIRLLFRQKSSGGIAASMKVNTWTTTLPL